MTTHEHSAQEREPGIRESLLGFARSGAHYLAVRGQLATAEAAVEMERVAEIGRAMAAAFILGFCGYGALLAALTLVFAPLVGGIAASAALLGVLHIGLATLCLRFAARRRRSRKFFATTRHELNQDLTCLTPNTTSR